MPSAHLSNVAIDDAAVKAQDQTDARIGESIGHATVPLLGKKTGMEATRGCGMPQAVADPPKVSRTTAKLSGAHRSPICLGLPTSQLPRHFPQHQAPWCILARYRRPACTSHARMPHAHRVVAGDGAAAEAHGQAAAIRGFSISHATIHLEGKKGGVAETRRYGTPQAVADPQRRSRTYGRAE